MTDTPKFPDNPNHANGTCEECGAPCQVYGCRWCPGCYDAASAALRETWRQPKAQTAAEWAASMAPSVLPIAAPALWQQAALKALGQPSAAVPATLAGLPLVVDRGVPAGNVLLWAARPGRAPAQLRAVCLRLDEASADHD